jgi:hypothetical protein
VPKDRRIATFESYNGLPLSRPVDHFTVDLILGPNGLAVMTAQADPFGVGGSMI